MREIPEAVMLYAAGFGTRMGELTRNRPKPLLEVAGKPLLDHALQHVSEAGVPRCVVNTHYLGEQIADHLSGKPGIAISHEDPDILETGGGLKNALPLLGTDPVFTLNSDAVWTGQNPLSQLASLWDPTRMDGLLLLIDPRKARGHIGHGDFLLDADGRLQRGPGKIYGGAQIMKTSDLTNFTEDAFSTNLFWDRMLEIGTLFGAIHRGGWCDVGHADGIGIAEAMLQEVANA